MVPWRTFASRIRMPITAMTVVVLLLGNFVEMHGWWGWLPLVALVIAAALYVRLGTPHGSPVDMRPPVQGRWRALNSPSSHVPSHHVHAWSQTYAVDLVHDPTDGSRPGGGWWPLARRPEDFPGFGQPIRAPIDGEVVRAHDWLRDHWSRTSPPGIAYLLAESVRELAGPVGVLGNHVVIRHADGTCVLMAHLQRRSLTVGCGDRVEAGDVIARCGNSGNSAEPHVHLQAMDTPSVWFAAGRPLCIDDHPLPENGDVLTTGTRSRWS